ncbi:MAG: L-rhamnose mutarotase [Bacteroidales bacterium]|nr:L-rhamnose mutarotase [Bacteroidales bacterium]
MKRVAFKMKLFPGKKDDYIKRHDEIWPELKQLLKDNGISDYTIFLDEETNILFAVQKVDENSGSSQDLGNNPIVKKWWAQNIDIMETNPDNSPVSMPLTEVFYME